LALLTNAPFAKSFCFSTRFCLGQFDLLSHPALAGPIVYQRRSASITMDWLSYPVLAETFVN